MGAAPTIRQEREAQAFLACPALGRRAGEHIKIRWLVGLWVATLCAEKVRKVGKYQMLFPVSVFLFPDS